VTRFFERLETILTVAAGIGGAGALQDLPMMFPFSYCVALRLGNRVRGRLTIKSRAR
jgi:hypothetical protein